MLFDIDKKPSDRLAALDDAGGQLTYGEIVSLRKELSDLLPARELVFCLCENKVGSLAGFLALYDCKDVCLLLNAAIDKGLLDALYATYHPSYFWMPVSKSSEYPYEVVFSYKDFLSLE